MSDNENVDFAVENINSETDSDGPTLLFSDDDFKTNSINNHQENYLQNGSMSGIASDQNIKINGHSDRNCYNLRRSDANVDYGFSFYVLNDQYIIDSVKIGSIAENVGLLNNMKITHINGQTVESLITKADALKTIGVDPNCVSIVVKEKDLSCSESKNNIGSDDKSRRFKCTHCPITMPSDNGLKLHKKWKHGISSDEAICPKVTPSTCNNTLRTVKLVKTESYPDYGFTIYTKEGCGHFVHTVNPDSLAAEAKLVIGNCILEINGKSVMKLPAADVQNLIKDSGKEVSLYILASSGTSYLTQSADVSQRAVGTNSNKIAVTIVNQEVTPLLGIVPNTVSSNLADKWVCDGCKHINDRIHTKYCFGCKKLKSDLKQWKCAYCLHENPDMYRDHCFSCKKPKIAVGIGPVVSNPKDNQWLCKSCGHKNLPVHTRYCSACKMPPSHLSQSFVSSHSLGSSHSLVSSLSLGSSHNLGSSHSLGSIAVPFNPLIPPPTMSASVPPPNYPPPIKPLVQDIVKVKSNKVRGTQRDVTLYKFPTYNGYGFRIVKDEEGYYINNVEIYSPAYSANLKVGDRVLYVNEQNVSLCSNEQLFSLILSYPNHVRLHVETFALPELPVVSKREEKWKNVKLFKKPIQSSYGFSIDTRGDQHFVYAIEPGSAADIAGLKRDDCIMEVNGISVSKIPYESIVAIVKRSPSILDLQMLNQDNHEREVNPQKRLHSFDFNHDDIISKQTRRSESRRSESLERTYERSRLSDNRNDAVRYDSYPRSEERSSSIPNNISSEEEYLEALKVSQKLNEALLKFKAKNLSSESTIRKRTSF